MLLKKSRSPERQLQFDRSYMVVAESRAELSYANRLKVGCVLVRDDQILSDGYNGTISGMSNVCEMEDGTTSPFTLHAEQNCLMKMARSTNSSIGSTLYVTNAPCPMCAKLLVQAGVTRVVYRHSYRDMSSLEFLSECGVEVVCLPEDPK